jgi:hypothetical protein
LTHPPAVLIDIPHDLIDCITLFYDPFADFFGQVSCPHDEDPLPERLKGGYLAVKQPPDEQDQWKDKKGQDKSSTANDHGRKEIIKESEKDRSRAQGLEKLNE